MRKAVNNFFDNLADAIGKNTGLYIGDLTGYSECARRRKFYNLTAKSFGVTYDYSRQKHNELKKPLPTPAIEEIRRITEAEYIFGSQQTHKNRFPSITDVAFDAAKKSNQPDETITYLERQIQKIGGKDRCPKSLTYEMVHNHEDFYEIYGTWIKNLKYRPSQPDDQDNHIQLRHIGEGMYKKYYVDKETYKATKTDQEPVKLKIPEMF